MIDRKSFENKKFNWWSFSNDWRTIRVTLMEQKLSGLLIIVGFTSMRLVFSEWSTLQTKLPPFWRKTLLKRKAYWITCDISKESSSTSPVNSGETSHKIVFNFLSYRASPILVLICSYKKLPHTKTLLGLIILH